MSNAKIIVDSSCDLDEALLERIQPAVVPLTLTIGEQDYVDDGGIDIPAFLGAMKSSETRAKSSCPSPALYMEQMLASAGDCYVITLSSRLSGSYNAAVLGREMALEADPGKRIHVFDSQSACAGETYLALLLHDLIGEGLSFEAVITAMNEKIRSLHTVFVLDSLDNLVKNGRMHKAAAFVANILSIKPVLSDDGEGSIKLAGKGRGSRGAIAQMVELCRKQTEAFAAHSQRLTLSYCNCLDRAREVRDAIQAKCPAIGEIFLTPTSGLSSMYAEDGGIVIAY